MNLRNFKGDKEHKKSEDPLKILEEDKKALEEFEEEVNINNISSHNCSGFDIRKKTQ